MGNLEKPHSGILQSVESNLAGSPASVPAALVSAGQERGLGRGEAVSLGPSQQGIAKTLPPLGYGEEGQDQNPSPNSGSMQKEATLAICRKKLLVAMGDAELTPMRPLLGAGGGGMPLPPLLWAWKRDLGEQRCRQELASCCLSH